MVCGRRVRFIPRGGHHPTESGLRLGGPLTQEALAHRSGLTATYVSLVENGHKAPTILAVRQLAEGLGVTAGRGG